MKAPFKVLFSNDTTKILTCRSPFNPRQNWPCDAATGTWYYDERPRVWVLPADVLRDGVNTVDVTHVAGDTPVEIGSADMGVST
ncbi:MAG: hypothetical protein A3K19_13300 [Lentisphaerae bacterium RIFOXYB12_FULL_65_16]|nr:MAG: hypothetical protein A3K18_01215 [Lentisphaerae bacterium RIFOXYA12_64_32]OGV90265.1 MAG: hypothetical protein A3K19_13300 [Lentisphaerae bacterium RIFOXYB12_FULL_65_16]